LSRMSMVTLP